MKYAQLKAKIKAGEIDTVIVAFPDVFGRLVGKRCTGQFFLESVATQGTHGCNYLLTVDIEMDPQEGFKLANWNKGFGDFGLKPDLSSCRLLPWQQSAVLVICDCLHENGTWVNEAPRSVLSQQLQRLARKGLTARVASELEFFLFNNSFHDAHLAEYRHLTPASDYRIDYHTMQPAQEEPLMRAIRNQMSGAEVPVESSKGEWGRGQHEINFRYGEPLAMGDMHTVFKQGVKEIATQFGKAVTFMAKPWAAEVGSSCHIHVSLWQGDRNFFGPPSASKDRARAKEKEDGVRAFRQFLGGLMKYSPELSYFFAPTINSYKRYQASSWAPTKMAWAHDNRTVGFRVVGQGNSFRIENRMPGADANPYLAFAAMLAAGMAGIEEKLDCGEDYQGNAYVDEKLPALPRTLRQSADLLNKSTLARHSFGDDVVDFYVHTAGLEADAYDKAVTDWERIRYFERI